MSEETQKTPEQIAQEEALKKQIEAKALEAEIAKKQEALDALKKEEGRVLSKLAQTREEKRTEEKNLEDKIRDENLKLATSRIAKELSLDETQVKSLIEQIGDIKSVTAESMEEELKKGYVSHNYKALLDLKAKNEREIKAAEAFAAAASSSSSAGSDRSDANYKGIELSQTELEAAKKFDIPVEKMKELKARGAI